MSTQNQQKDELKLEEIEVAINDLDSTVAQQNAIGALDDLPGIRGVRAVRGGLMISYNPIGISCEEIRDAIERAGFTVDGVETGRQSPLRPNPQPTREPLDYLRPPPKVHPDPGGA